MKILVLAILIGIVSSLSDVIFGKLFATYIPVTKKIASFIMKLLFFSLRYIAPIVFIFYLMNSDQPLTKLFILEMCLVFFALNFNLWVDVYRRVSKDFWFFGKLHEKHIEIHKQQSDIIAKQTGLIQEVNKKTNFD